MTRVQVVAALLVSLLLTAVSCKVQSDEPARGPAFLNQGWSQEQRQEFYHKSQGTRLIPLRWLQALKQNGSMESFLADANVASFRFIPDSKHKFNEEGLPVGFAVTEFPGTDNASQPVKWVGYTCAACHTSRIVAGGKTVQIDGAPSMHNNLLFVGAMVAALKETAEDVRRLDDFAAAIHPTKSPSAEEKEAIRKKILAFLDTLDKLSGKQAVERARKDCQDPEMKRKYDDPNFSVFPKTTWGFGRLDAVGRASNTVFARYTPDGKPEWHGCNLDTADGQVSIPKIWHAWKYDWVQWNAFVQNPLARNLAQALALGADPNAVDVTALGWMEDQLHSLQPPRWEDVFGPVDSKLAAEGKALYHEGRSGRPVKGGLCAHCHVPESKPLACDGKEEWAMVLVQVEENTKTGDPEAIGTDRTTMENYTRRLKRPAPRSGLSDPFPPAIAMSALTSKVIAARLEAQKVPEPDRKRLQRCRANAWWSLPMYKAPTHEGVWATAPYLHNGSIPNLYLLLSPKEERDKQARVFCVGHDLTYDPVNVGFVLTDQCPGPSARPDLYKFDTTLRNNGNMGHEFRKAPDCEKREGGKPEQGVLGCELSDHERKALVEYLKSL
jgi:cytochrome c peroxidase